MRKWKMRNWNNSKVENLKMENTKLENSKLENAKVNRFIPATIHVRERFQKFRSLHSLVWANLT